MTQRDILFLWVLEWLLSAKLEFQLAWDDIYSKKTHQTQFLSAIQEWWVLLE